MIKIHSIEAVNRGIIHLSESHIVSIEQARHAEDGFYVCTIADSYPISEETATTLLSSLQGDKPSAALDELHLAVLVTAEGGTTSNNSRPMWRCTTDDGERVNIFLNTDDKEKDSFHLFEAAGWGETLKNIGNYVTQDIQIFVALKKSKDGKWWEIAKVRPYRQPDVPF